MGLLTTIAVAGYALAPTGFYQFCARQPEQCRPVATRRELSLAEIDAVNRRVNASIRPQAEPPVQDDWKVGGASGDCEDYALKKRNVLLKAGLGTGRVRLAVGVLRDGEFHAVLIVTTKSGDRVLDNLNAELLSPGRVEFEILSVQSAENPMVWLRVKH